MSNRKYDHLIAGISQYPDLEKRLEAELSFSKPSNGACNQCQKNRIVRKFQAIVETRRKKEPPRRY
jgi:hypothetical protein